MNGFEWGMSKDQVATHCASLGNEFTVCGVNVGTPEFEYSKSGLYRIFYTLAKGSTSDQLLTQYANTKTVLKLILGTPDQDYQNNIAVLATWHFDDVDATLIILENLQEGGYYIRVVLTQITA